MKIKTLILSDRALDWALALSEGQHPIMLHDYMRAKAAANNYKGDLEWHLSMQVNEPIIVDVNGVTQPIARASTDGALGILIMEREGIVCSPEYEDNVLDDTRLLIGSWKANLWNNSIPGTAGFMQWATGPTLLIAAMRCRVASKLGDEVDIPEALCQASKLGDEVDAQEELCQQHERPT